MKNKALIGVVGLAILAPGGWVVFQRALSGNVSIASPASIQTLGNFSIGPSIPRRNAPVDTMTNPIPPRPSVQYPVSLPLPPSVLPPGPIGGYTVNQYTPLGSFGNPIIVGPNEPPMVEEYTEPPLPKILFDTREFHDKYSGLVTSSSGPACVSGEDIFYYAVETRHDYPKSPWETIADVFSFDPATNCTRKVTNIPATASIPYILLNHDGKLYTWYSGAPRRFVALEPQGPRPIITMPSGRHISDVRILSDGRIVLTTGEFGLRENANMSRLDIFTADGDRMLTSLHISTTSPMYGGVGIMGINEEKNLVYLDDGGGDAGEIWGTIYLAHMDSGRVEKLGGYSGSSGEGYIGFYPGSFNPSATYAVIVSPNKNKLGAQISITDLVSKEVSSFDIKTPGVDGYIRQWLDNENIVLFSEDTMYIVNIHTRGIKQLSIPMGAIRFATTGSTGRRYIAITDCCSKAEIDTVSFIDMKTNNHINPKIFTSFTGGAPFGGKEYIQTTSEFLNVR